MQVARMQGRRLQVVRPKVAGSQAASKLDARPQAARMQGHRLRVQAAGSFRGHFRLRACMRGAAGNNASLGGWPPQSWLIFGPAIPVRHSKRNWEGLIMQWRQELRSTVLMLRGFSV